MKARPKSKIFFILPAAVVLLGVGGYAVLSASESLPAYDLAQVATGTLGLLGSTTPPVYVPTHIATPSPVKAIYMTSYVAGVKTWREKMAKLIDDTEVNAIVIDVKDYTGVLVEKRAPDIVDYIHELHDKNIYVIGRVSAFQDQAYVKSHPNLAVKRKDNGEVWRDHKGIAWLDAGSKDAWDYIAKVSEDAYAQGFDEINLDYIRFPSDGDMANTDYTFEATSSTKVEVMRQFYQYIAAKLHEKGIPVSADLFGMTTTNHDDLGIGQNLENALRSFDFVAPMVYPSHFPPTFNGWKDPNKVPGQLINFVMNHAVARADEMDAVASSTASTTAAKLRPWLQDFQYGGHYGVAEVRAQIEGAYANGLTSWMMWDPAVKYTPGVFDKVASST